ncbi:TonB-dependent receptor family protein [Flavobacterium sp. UBA6135]|uniref:TonB-dependent receptor family protein n=1 Tax=Flavobacterium sp. UBA6135 TaxID=1946553 RepID=UPI0025BFFDBA|nr:TonB-dependent receptor [Flavobacterium sp. UBA6135]
MKNIVSLCLVALTGFAYSQNTNESFDDIALNDSVRKLNGVTVHGDALIGSKFKAKNRAGSTYFISPEELKTFNYTDINRILRTVPGINVVEEEGFGLRPSIGLRGTSPSRASKITLMEDGILIAPAPYSAPAAYYFPTVNRIQSFEILKGGSQIQYGPYTTGGAINMVSNQIPSQFSGKIVASMGSFDTKNTYVNLGDNFKNFGYLVEYNNRNSEGFKTIDFSDRTTGYNGNDYVAKFRVNTNPEAKVFQSLTLKAQLSDEYSDETYLGLTQNDFNNNPYRRYLSSEVDKIDTKHDQLMLTHLAIPTDYLTITTKAYRNNFRRNWYKLHDVNVGGSNVSLASILENPEANQAGYDILTGATNTADNALRMRNNNRGYLAEGIQTAFNFKLNSEILTHDIDFGVRYHLDSEDRFQWDDRYKIQNNSLFRTVAGTPGTQDNRVENAEAVSVHVLYNLTYKKLTFSPGMRYENIIRRSLNYGTSDLDRTGINLNRKQNRVEKYIPGFGALYKISEDYSAFTSVHKGFSPPGSNEGDKGESSMNYEAGFRFNKKALSGEIIAFYNDFARLEGADTNASGGTGTGDLFNAGQARVQGLELLVTYDVLNNENSKFKLPITFSYTYTDTELKNEFNSGTEAWGQIQPGDEIPYIAKNQFSITANLEHKKFNFAISGKYNDQFRTLAGQGAIPDNELVKSNFIVDASAKYHLTQKVSLMSNIVNLLDKEYAVSRVPAGLRPGMPFGIHFGVTAQF